MKDWMMKFFETLAGKLTAILAFAVLLIALLALWGSRIPPDYKALVYIVAILAMVIFTLNTALGQGVIRLLSEIQRVSDESLLSDQDVGL
ncbi:MAG: hypothetical protein J7555_11405 [Chloroflexi bacterium]|nr:hypothetical protein [Chloroflexota bacterium]